MCFDNFILREESFFLKFKKRSFFNCSSYIQNLLFFKKKIIPFLNYKRFFLKLEIFTRKKIKYFKFWKIIYNRFLYMKFFIKTAECDMFNNLVHFKKKISKNYNKITSLGKIYFFLNYKNYTEVFYPNFQKIDTKSIKLGSNFFPSWIKFFLPFLYNLNYIQTKIFPAAFGTDLNLLISSPTGSGKTTLATLCILRIINNSIKFQNGKWKIFKDFTKILYIAPIKTIVKEITINFQNYFINLGLKIKEITGDMIVNPLDFFSSNIIIGTPEKIELLSQNEKFLEFFSQIRLFIIDEIHVLNDERGSTLEQVIIRFLIEKKESRFKKKCRIIGLSATIPNFLDIGKFLYINPNKGLFYFNNLFRSVPLHQTFIGLKKNSLDCKKKYLLNDLTYRKINDILKKKDKNNLIIFVQSRKDTIKTAFYLLSKKKTQPELTNEFLLNSKNTEQSIRNMIKQKIGIHHAGLSKEKRLLIEHYFKIGKLKILISTSTLAWGVNLPATHVIIKGTRIYCPKKSSWCEISDINAIQMIGRAGRSSKRNDSEGIILTSYKNLSHYISLVNNQIPIESRTITTLPDFFNSECAKNRIDSISSAMNWFTKTYLFVRLHRFLSRQKYFLFGSRMKNSINLLEGIFVSQIIKELKAAGMVLIFLKNGRIFSTYIGLISSNFFVSHQTIIMFLSKLRPTLKHYELLSIFSLSYEFSSLKIRIGEEKEIKRLQDLSIFPIRGKFFDFSFKSNLLIQAFIGNVRIFNPTLTADTIYVGKISCRLARAFLEIIMLRRWASLANKSFELYQAICTQTWPGKFPLRKFLSSPSYDKYVKIIEKKNLDVEIIKKFSEKELEIILNSKQGASVINKICKYMPVFMIKINLQPLTRNTLMISISIKMDTSKEETSFRKKIGFWIFLEDQICDTLIFYNFFFFKKQTGKIEFHLNFYVPLFDNPISPFYYIRIKCDDIFKSNMEMPIDLTNINLPINHPFENEILKSSDFSFARILVGFLPGMILTEYFETHFLKTFGFLYQIILNISRHSDHRLISFNQNKVRSLLKEFSVLPFLSNSKKIIFVYFSGGFESFNLKKDRIGGCSVGIIGIPIEKKDGERKNIILKSKKIVFFIMSCTEWSKIKFQFKKIISWKVVFVVDFLHLIGDLNFSSGLESVCNELFFKDFSNINIFIIGSLFPILNLFELSIWLNLKSYQVFSFQFKKKLKYQKKLISSFKTFHSLKMNFLKKNFTKYQPSAIVFFEKKREIFQNFINLISHSFIFTEFALPRRSLFFHKTFLDRWKKNNIFKIFLGLKMGILKENWKYKRRRIVEELFVSDCFKLLLSSFGIYGIIDSEKLSSAQGFFILNLWSCEKRSISSFFYMFFHEKCRNVEFFTKNSIFSIKNLFFLYFLTESVGLKTLKDNLIRFIIEKKVKNYSLLLDRIIMTFYSIRLEQNPQFYGFFKKPNVIRISEQISKLMMGKYANKFFVRKETPEYSEVSIIGLTIVFYFLPEKIIDSLLSCLEKKLTFLKLTKIIKKMNELLFLKNIFEKDQLVKNGLNVDKNLIIKLNRSLKKSSFYTNQIISLKLSLKRLVIGWVNLYRYKSNLNSVFFLIELSQRLRSKIHKNCSSIKQLSIFNNLGTYLLGKVHDTYSASSLLSRINDFYDRMFLNQNKNFIKNLFRRFQILNCVTLNVFISKLKLKKQSYFIMNIKTTLYKNFPFFLLPQIDINLERFMYVWWLIIGDTMENVVIIVSEIFIRKPIKVKIKFMSAFSTKNLKIFFLNAFLPFLDNETRMDLSQKIVN